MTDKASERRPGPGPDPVPVSGPVPGPDEGPAGGTLRRSLVALSCVALSLLAGCATQPWSELSYGGPPGPLPIEPIEPGELAPSPQEAPAAGSATEEPEGAPGVASPPPRFDLTRETALVTALVNNPGLEVARFGPRIAGMEVPEALAAFDPRLTSSTVYEDDEHRLTAIESLTFRPLAPVFRRPPAPPFDLDRQTLDVSATLSSRLPTGTAVALSGVVDRSDTNFTPREYEGAWWLEVHQPLLEGRGKGVNLISLRQAKNAAVQSEWQVRRAVLDLVAEVERAYWELALAERIVAIREEGVGLAADQLAWNEELAGSDPAERSAVVSARADEASRRADLEAARGRRRAMGVRMLRLLNPPGLDRLGPGGEVRAIDAPRVERIRPDVEASVKRALDRRPEVFYDRIETLNRGLDVAAAEDALKPEIDLVASYGRTSLGRELGDGLDDLVGTTRFDSYRVALEVEVPLVGRGELARYRSARLSELRAEAMLEDTALRVTEEVRRAVIGVETEWARVEATEQAVASREEELRIESDRYRQGEGRNLDVLEVQRLLIEARVAEATAKVRYLQALTELDRAEGTLLEKRGIAFSGLSPDPRTTPGKRPAAD